MKSVDNINEQLLNNFDAQLQAALLNDLIAYRWDKLKELLLTPGSNQDNDLLVA